MDSELRNKTIKGIGWSTIDNGAHYVVTFVVGIILARLLTPDDFGVLGLTAIFTTICNSIINGGFSSALIRKKDVSENDYSTAFLVNLTSSIVLYALLFLLSPFISQFFEREILECLIRISSLGIIIGSFGFVQRVRLIRQINFKSQAEITLIGAFVSGLVGVLMAVLGFGVWSLVILTLVNISVKTVLLCCVNKWMPSLSFSQESFASLFGYGWKIMVSSIIDTLWSEMNKVVVGKCYSPASLGQFSRAQQFNNLLSGNLTGIIQRVTFPVLSSIQDDKQRIADAYKKIIRSIVFVTALSLFFMGAVSEPLVYCLIGPKWYEASVYIPLMCVSGSVFPLIAVNKNILQVNGRSDLYLYLTFSHKILSVIPLLIGIFVGIVPMLLANIITISATYFISSYFTGRAVGCHLLEQLSDIAPSFGLGLLVAVSVYFLKYLSISFWIILPIQVIVGLLVSIFVCELKRMKEYTEIKEAILSMRP